MAIKPIPRLHHKLTDLGGSLGAHGQGIGWFSQIIAPMDVNSALLGVEGRMYMVPVYAPRPVRLNQARCTTTIAGTVGAVARLGIYRGRAVSGSGELGTPQELQADFGTVSTEGGTGTKSIAIDHLLPEGVYWLAVVPQGAPATHATFRATTGQHPFLGGLFGIANIGGATRDGVTGALPGPLPGFGPVSSPVIVGSLNVAAWL
jgi:hypothetical protein